MQGGAGRGGRGWLSVHRKYDGGCCWPLERWHTPAAVAVSACGLCAARVHAGLFRPALERAEQQSMRLRCRCRRRRGGAQQCRQRQAAAPAGADRGAQPSADAAAQAAGGQRALAAGQRQGLLMLRAAASRQTSESSWLGELSEGRPERSPSAGCCTPAQGVFDLPRKLRAAIDRGALEVAVDSYADVAPLLRKYGHKVGAGRPAASSALWPLCSGSFRASFSSMHVGCRHPVGITPSCPLSLPSLSV